MFCVSVVCIVWALPPRLSHWIQLLEVYLIKTGFTLGEAVLLVKVFRLLDWNVFFLGVQNVDTVGRCTTSYLLAGPACLCSQLDSNLRPSSLNPWINSNLHLKCHLNIVLLSAFEFLFWSSYTNPRKNKKILKLKF